MSITCPNCAHEFPRPSRPAGQEVGYGRNDAVRPDQASPRDWSPMKPEMVRGIWVRPWRSPNGRRWVSESVIGPLLDKRLRVGLSTTWEQEQQAVSDPSASTSGVVVA